MDMNSSDKFHPSPSSGDHTTHNDDLVIDYDGTESSSHSYTHKSKSEAGHPSITTIIAITADVCMARRRHC
jgi:hypothetical protein